MSDHDLVIRGGRLIGAEGEVRTDVGVRGEQIASVGTGLRGRREIEADGLYLLPGAVDGHVHMRTDRPVHVYDDTFETGSIAAAFGGVTAIVDQAQVEPGTSLLEGLRRRRAEADGACVIDYGIHVNLREPSLERVAEIPEVMAEGCPTIKLFMSYETYRLPDDIIFRAMQRVADGGGMAVVHAENGTMVAELTRELEELGRMGPESFPDISPPVLEGEAAHRVLALARLAGCRLLIFHLTTVDSLSELRRARGAGQEAFGEALLHHLLLGEELYRDPDLAPQFMGTPPLRSLEHRDALWAGLADGSIDIVSTTTGRAGECRTRPGCCDTAPGRAGRGAAGPDAQRRGARRSHQPSPVGRALLYRARSPARAPSEGTPGAGLRRRHRALRPGGRAHALGRRPALRHRPLDLRRDARTRLAGRDHRARRGRRLGRRASRGAGPGPVRAPRAAGARLTYWREWPSF